MNESTSELIRFLSETVSTGELRYKAIRIKSDLIDKFRSRIRLIYSVLLEDDDHSNRVANLRLELLKIQSSPVVPPLIFLENCGLGGANKVKDIWGLEVYRACKELEEILSLLHDDVSPFIRQAEPVISEHLHLYGPDMVKIWAHRNEKQEFIREFQKVGVALQDSHFISSSSLYKDVSIFKSLFRFGPLRSFGWSRVPKVLLSVPKYNHFTQFLWSTSYDEDDFFVDSIVDDINYLSRFDISQEEVLLPVQVPNISLWLDDEADDDYEFLLNKPINMAGTQQCVLVEFLRDKGVLLTPNSEQLVYRKISGGNSFSYKKAKEIEPQDTLLLYKVDADLGGSGLSHKGIKLAPLWKSALDQMHSHSYSYLISKMHEEGIDLSDLDRAAKDWKKMDEGEVIHGPQSKSHFKILIDKVLPDCLGEGVGWADAWKEIQNSRVGAIQYGRIESSIADEELLNYLNVHEDSLFYDLAEQSSFALTLDESTGLSGSIDFYLVDDFSVDFKAPENAVGVINCLADIEIYRYAGVL
jgi:hypothetical protein